MADNGRLKIGFGTLNNVEPQKFGRVLDTRNTSGFDILRQNAADSFKNNTLAGVVGHFKGIALRIDINPATNPLNSWEQQINPNSKPRLSVKVRIPELHACLMEPRNYGINCDSSNHIIDMYPTFVAVSDEVALSAPAPGDIVWVDFGNRANMTDPQYHGIAYKHAQGGAVGLERIEAMFADNDSSLGVLPPLGDSTFSGLVTEENQIPGIMPLQSTRTSETTMGSFLPQKNHVVTPSGMPPLKNPEMAYEKGTAIGLIQLVEVRSPHATKSGIFIAKSQEKIFYDLVNAAKNDGVLIKLNSGFRSHEQQQYLYQKHLNGTGNLAAKPGYSNHQNGTAFDFATGDHRTEIYTWLATNSHKFGFYNSGRFFSGQKEHWHFQYLGVNNPKVIAEGRTPLSEKWRSFA